jgi:hypothetical protein
MKNIFFAFLLLCFFASSAFAYPEFYEYSRKVSGRAINCALCHTHGDGPEGNEPGQISSLTKEEMEKLMRARAAFAPGQVVESPILNELGNKLVEYLGKKKILELRTRPQDLAKEIGQKLDIDKDGIPDAQEYLDGTLAISKEDGHPAKLFLANLKKNILHIVLALCAVGFLFYGFVQWLMGIYGEAVLQELKRNKKGETND